MTSPSSTSATITAPALPRRVEFAYRPWRDNRFGLAAVVLGAAAVASLATLAPGGAIWWSGPAVLAWLATTARLWLPQWYEIDARGVDCRTLGRRWRLSWTDIAAYEPTSDGVVLLPAQTDSRLAVVQGRRLRCGPARDTVLAYVGHFVRRR